MRHPAVAADYVGESPEHIQYVLMGQGLVQLHEPRRVGDVGVQDDGKFPSRSVFHLVLFVWFYRLWNLFLYTFIGIH